MRYKTRGAVERFTSDNVQIASILNGSQNDPFYSILSCQFVFEGIFNLDVVYAKKIEAKFLRKSTCFYHIYKDSFTAMISFLF